MCRTPFYARLCLGTYVGCMDVFVPVSHLCVCEYLCAMRCWFAGDNSSFYLSSGFGLAWPEDQGRLNGAKGFSLWYQIKGHFDSPGRS